MLNKIARFTRRNFLIAIWLKIRLKAKTDELRAKLADKSEAVC